MKKPFTIVLLCVLLLLGCCACSSKNDAAQSNNPQTDAASAGNPDASNEAVEVGWFPYGLKLGQSFDEVKAVLAAHDYTLSAPEKSDVGAYQFRISDMVLYFDWSFLRSDTLTALGSSTEAFMAKKDELSQDQLKAVSEASMSFHFSSKSPGVVFFFENDLRLSGILCMFDNSTDELFALFDETVKPESTDAFAALFGNDGYTGSGDNYAWEGTVGDDEVKVMIYTTEDEDVTSFAILGKLP